MAGEINIGTHQQDWFKGFETNATDTSFSDPVVTTTEPVTNGVGTWVGEIERHNSIAIMPYGTDAANETFDFRLWAWAEMRDLYDASSVPVWIPTLICTCTCTLSTLTGVAAAALLNTEFLADTITSVSPSPSRSQHLLSPGTTTGNISGAIYVGDVFGFQKAELRVDLTGAASANFLYRWF
jgi:hypothetical protein